MTSAATTRTERAPSAWWKRLLLAQESGLVLVIALFMAVLTALGGTRPDRQVIRPDANTTITQESGVFRVTTDGRERTLSEADGWAIAGPRTAPFLQRTGEVNKFFNLQNLMQVLVNASFIAVMAVGITAVIAMGGIDLSIGSIYALAALMTGIALRYHWPAGNAWPDPSVMGSGGLWFALLGAGLVGLVGSVIAWKRAGAAAVSGAPQRSDRMQALAKGLAAGGVGVLLIVGWQLLRAMRDGWDSTQEAALPLSQSLPLALLVALVVGGVCGLANGVMIVGLRVHPFIITLGTMAAYRGLCSLPTQSQSVGNMSPSLQEFIRWEWMGVTPVPVLIMLGVALLGMLVLSRTVIGRQVYAIGGNETAATYAGIPVGVVKIIVFTVMGVLAGLSGLLYLAYYGAAEPGAGNGYELSVIAAAVIGGASLSGGRGSAAGAVLGAILVQLIENSLIILDIDQSYRNVVLGAAIIGAVVLDQLKGRLMPKGR